MKLLIVDDHPLMRFAVRQLVEARWLDARVTEADSLEQALSCVRGGGFDVAILDLSLPDVQGLEGLSTLRRAAPSLPLLVLSMHAESAYATRALQLGASGYLAKDHATTELIGAIERVRSGGRYISPAVAELLADAMSGKAQGLPHEQLSAQELRVMLLIASGRSASEIAETMHLSVKTVGTYRARILEKTRLPGTAEIARYCAEHGLI